MKEKKGFGVIGGVMFLLAMFMVFGLLIWSLATQGAAGQPPVMHIDATVISSDQSNDCDIFLLNLLRYRDSEGLTYGERIIQSKQIKDSTTVGKELQTIIEDDIIERDIDCIMDCFEIIAQGEGDEEPFISFAPCGKCDKRFSIGYCEAYLPEFNPEDERIKVQMAIEVFHSCGFVGDSCGIDEDCCKGYYCSASSGYTCQPCQPVGITCDCVDYTKCIPPEITHDIENCCPTEWCCSAALT